MEIKTKSGITLNITEIAGTQEDPTITVEKFTVQGKITGGKAVIQHWSRQNVEEGLYFSKGDVYCQCATAMPAIREVIAQLPHKKYFARKVERIIDSDGYQITVQEWKIDRMAHRADGNLIGETELGRFLDKMEITDIEICEAEKLWNENHDLAATQKREAESARRARAIFDDDEADQGYAQACENAGFGREQSDDMMRG
jgi:hypothetical protein